MGRCALATVATHLQHGAGAVAVGVRQVLGRVDVKRV